MIEAGARRALTELRRLDWAPTEDDVWTPLDIHIDELNGEAGAAVLRAFQEAASTGRSPIGLVVEGRQGAGKTHLVRWAREQVQRAGHGYFFLLGITDGRSFWPSLVHTLLRGLRRSGSYRHTQLAVLLDRLSELARIPSDLRLRIRGRGVLTREDLDTFVSAVRRVDPETGRECRFVLRALVMLGASDDAIADLGEAWLTGAGEDDSADRMRWGLPLSPPPQTIAGLISRLVALTGPAMFAVDQVDTIFAQARKSAVADGSGETIEPVALAADLGRGLMELRQTLSRTVTVVACLPSSWNLITAGSLPSVPGRFRVEARLSRLPSAEVGRELVTKRFDPFFENAGFQPPYPTWPVLPEAFDTALDFTPRSLLQRVDDHIRVCLERDEVVPLADLRVPPPAEPVVSAPDDASRVAAIAERFTRLREEAEVGAALAPATEDAEMSRLISAGLRAWTIEQGGSRGRFKVVPGQEGSPSMHACLSETLDEETEDEAHWYFRGISHGHYRAVQARLGRFSQLVQLAPDIDKRRAVLLRNPAWPTGPVSRRVREEFLASGGVLTSIEEDDLRAYAALAVLLEENDPALPGWLRSTRPAGRTTLFRLVFGPPPDDGPQPAGEPTPPKPVDTFRSGPAEAAADPASLMLGTVPETGRTVNLGLESLRKHVAIFAGSGSGKTVLVRRLVEECALRGVSTIVLDPNNDLARLGDPWPEPPPAWRAGDQKRAADYLAGADVVVWTPRRESGRPLSLRVSRWTAPSPRWRRGPAPRATPRRRTGAGPSCAWPWSTSPGTVVRNCRTSWSC